MGDRLEEIFECQRALMEKFHPVEVQNGAPPVLAHEHPEGLNARPVQRHLKELAWRAMEELFEAYWVYKEDQISLDNPTMEIFKLHEELVDVYHFLVELTISSGMDAAALIRYAQTGQLGFNWAPDKLSVLAAEAEVFALDRPENMHFLDLASLLAASMHQLKNNPWKQKLTPVDERSYFHSLVAVHLEFMQLCKSVGLSPSELHRKYVHKHQVNLQRQKDGR